MDARRPAPRTVDAAAWIGWALAGLYACALPGENAEGENAEGEDAEARRGGPWVPPIRVMVREARRVAVVVAMHRHGGNITHAAEALGTSRRSLRDTLKTAGLYPWAGMTDDDDDDASTTRRAGSDVPGGDSP
jgi:DNA-binding NtrC family response regulator